MPCFVKSQAIPQRRLKHKRVHVERFPLVLEPVIDVLSGCVHPEVQHEQICATK